MIKSVEIKNFLKPLLQKLEMSILKILNNRIFLATSSVAIIRGLSMAGALLLPLIFLKTFNTGDYGEYSVVLASSLVLSFFLTMGLPTIILRLETNNSVLISTFLLKRLIPLLFFGLVFTTICHIFFFEGHNALTVLSLALSFALIRTVQSVYRGRRNFISGLLPEIFVKYVLPIFIISLCSNLTINDFYNYYIIGTTLFTMWASIIFFRYHLIHFNTQINFKSKAYKIIGHQMVFVGSYQFVANVVKNLDVIVVAYYFDYSTAAFFKLVKIFSDITLNIDAMMSTTLAPFIKKIDKNGEAQKIQKLGRNFIVVTNIIGMVVSFYYLDVLLKYLEIDTLQVDRAHMIIALVAIGNILIYRYGFPAVFTIMRGRDVMVLTAILIRLASYIVIFSIGYFFLKELAVVIASLVSSIIFQRYLHAKIS